MSIDFLLLDKLEKLLNSRNWGQNKIKIETFSSGRFEIEEICEGEEVEDSNDSLFDSYDEEERSC